MSVLEFRRANAPQVHPGLADIGRRGVVTGVAPPTISLPCDSENHPQPFAFHAPHGVDKGFVCSDAMDSASAVYGWFLACLAVECAFGALVWAFA